MGCGKPASWTSFAVLDGPEVDGRALSILTPQAVFDGKVLSILTPLVVLDGKFAP